MFQSQRTRWETDIKPQTGGVSLFLTGSDTRTVCVKFIWQVVKILTWNKLSQPMHRPPVHAYGQRHSLNPKITKCHRIFNIWQICSPITLLFGQLKAVCGQILQPWKSKWLQGYVQLYKSNQGTDSAYSKKHKLWSKKESQIKVYFKFKVYLNFVKDDTTLLDIRFANGKKNYKISRCLPSPLKYKIFK